MDKHQFMREGIAKEYGIQMWKRYSEPEAAHFLGIDLKTLKGLRYAGKTDYVQFGPRNIRYNGYQIIDLILFGDKWRSMQSENFVSETGTLASEAKAPHGIEPDTTPKQDGPSVSASLARILSKPRKS